MTEKYVELVLSQEDAPQTHSTVGLWQIARETRIEHQFVDIN